MTLSRIWGNTYVLSYILKYYIGFYIYYLKNPPKHKRAHYFDKDFFDFCVFSEKKNNQSSYLNELNERIFIVQKSSKESDIMDKYNLKFQHYLAPHRPLITELRAQKRKKIISSGELPNFRKTHYNVFESLHIFYPDIMGELDSKILSLLLGKTSKKNN